MARALAAASATAAWAAAVAGSEVRGVAPAEQAKYSLEPFRCGGAELAPGAVNDDFCDCADGSDEPGTAACAGSGVLFYCANEQSDPAYIYTSQVNDGVCDCCDGSDEWRGDAAALACVNTCAAEGKALKRERDRQLSELRSGIRQRASLISKAQQERKGAEAEKEQLRGKLPDLEKALQDAKALLTAAEAAVAAEATKAEAESGENATEEAVSEAPQEAPGAAEVSEAKPEAKPEAAEAKPVVSEYSKWMEGAEQLDEFDKGKPAEPKVEDALAKEPPAPAPAPKEEEKAGGFSAKVSELWHSLLGWFRGRRSPAERALDAAQQQHKEAEKRLSESKKQLEVLEGKLDSGTEEWELAFSGLDGRCIEKSIGEYKYKICFFEDAKQDHTSIGRWKGWEGRVASFANGQYCPSGPERSLRVKFQCGAEELLDVYEPSRCSYEAQLKHPAACTPELLRALENRGPRLPRAEL